MTSPCGYVIYSLTHQTSSGRKSYPTLSYQQWDKQMNFFATGRSKGSFTGQSTSAQEAGNGHVALDLNLNHAGSQSI
jgi:hypothetical protein